MRLALVAGKQQAVEPSARCAQQLVDLGGGDLQRPDQSVAAAAVPFGEVSDLAGDGDHARFGLFSGAGSAPAATSEESISATKSCLELCQPSSFMPALQ